MRIIGVLRTNHVPKQRDEERTAGVVTINMSAIYTRHGISDFLCQLSRILPVSMSYQKLRLLFTSVAIPKHLL